MKLFLRGVRSWCLSGMLVFGCLPLCASAKEPVGSSVADVLFELGLRAYKTGQYDEALHEFKKLVLYQPDHQQAIYYITLIEKKEQQRDAAISAAFKAIETQASPQPSSRVASPLGEGIESSAGTQPVPAVSSPGPAGPSSKALEEEDARSASSVSSAPVRRTGEIGLFINNVEVNTSRPIIVEQGHALVPLKDVAAGLYVSLMQLAPGRFQLMFPQGFTKEITVSQLDPNPMVTEQELRDLFAATTLLDEPNKAFHLDTGNTPSFQTYTIAKPAEELQKEQAEQELAHRVSQLPEERGEIPEAAKPSIDLAGTMSYSYRGPHRGPPARTLVTSLTGTAYGYDVRGELSRKDRSGTFRDDYDYLNFTKPDLVVGLFDQQAELAPLRGQSAQFNGVKTRKTWDRILTTTFLGGETENTISSSSGTVKYLGQLYGTQQELTPADWWTLRSGLLYMQNNADLLEQVATTNFPRQDWVTSAGTTFRLPENISVSGDLARSIYHPDNKKVDTIEDWNWRVGTSIEQPRYNAGFVYEFVGNQYASLGNPLTYQDYEGWNLFGSYRLMDAWSVSSSMLRFNNNVDDDPSKITQDNQALSFSSSLQLPAQQAVTVSLNDFLANPSGPDPGSSNRTKLYRIDYALPFLFDTRLLLNYQNIHTFQHAANDSLSHGVGVALFRGFEGGSSIYLSQQYTKTLFEDAANDDTLSSTINVNYQAHPRLALYLNSSYGRDVTQLHKGTDSLSGSTGFRLQLSPGTTLTSEYRVDSYTIEQQHGRWPKNWSTFVALSQSFGFISAPNFGAIEGVIIKDLNANGKADLDEPGIDDVTVRLENGREILTSGGGHFSFSRVVPGPHKVTVDVGSLPTEWAMATPTQDITVGRQKQVKLTSTIVKASSIQGRVFVDKNGDGVFQESEEPLDQIAVILLPGEQFRRTDAEGAFLFDHLLPGTYTLKIYRQDIPAGYELTSKEEIPLLLTAGEDVKDIVFTVKILSGP